MTTGESGRGNTMDKVIFYGVTKKDAGLLVSWWNANTSFYHFRVKTGKLYKFVRQQ
jgi:hypothetical protein